MKNDPLFTSRNPRLQKPFVSHTGLGLIAAVIALALDQVTKIWVTDNVTALIELAPFFNLTISHNKGIGMGLLYQSGVMPWVLSLIAAVVVAILVRWLRQAEHRVTAFGLGLIIGGAIGNVADRLRLGSVVDFLDFHIADWHWYTFNIADSFICVGVALLIIDGMFGKKPKI